MIEVPPPPVVVVVCHNGNTRASFTFCLTRLLVAETCRQGFPPGLIFQRFASDQLVDARNDTVRCFLEQYPDTEWALFLDADMGFAADIAERLVAAADPVERPIVGALCFALRREGAEDDATQAVPLRMQPTIYTYHDIENDAGFAPMKNYPRDALVQTAATGMACVLVHRTVLEKISAEYGPTWFDRIPNPKQASRFGEDMSFCIRAAGVGLSIFVDTSVKTSHDKDGIFLTEDRWDEQQARAEVP